MATTNVSFRMDEALKKQAEAIFDEMGMNMTTAFTIFTKAVVRSGKIPFEISVDPLRNAGRQAHSEHAVAEKFLNAMEDLRLNGFSEEDNEAIDALQRGEYKLKFEERLL